MSGRLALVRVFGGVFLIISFKNNFIFIRTRKTASTSTEIVLSSWCGKDDVVTPVGPEDELVRLNYGGAPSNFCSDKGLEKEYLSLLSSRDLSLISDKYRKIKRKQIFQNHASAKEVRDSIPSRIWEGSFKFAFDRHPYEKVVSLTFWRRKLEVASGVPVEEFIDEIIDQAEYRNFELYSEGGHVLLDKIFKYEDLSSVLGCLAARYFTSISEDLPMAKGQYRKDRRPAALILSQKQRNSIYEICRDEFDYMGYVN